MGYCFASKILEEFDMSEDPEYHIEYDLGPFGSGNFSGKIYDPKVLEMIITESERLIPQSPKINPELRRRQVSYYEQVEEAMARIALREVVSCPLEWDGFWVPCLGKPFGARQRKLRRA